MSKSTISTFKLFETFSDEEAARIYLEGLLWPNGVKCPDCKSGERITARHRANRADVLMGVPRGCRMKRAAICLALVLIPTARPAFSQYSKRESGFITTAPAANSKRRKIDRYFVGLSVLEMAADAADIATRQEVQRTNPASPEVSPILGPHPSAARMALTQLPFTVAENVLAYKLRKSKRLHRFWQVPFLMSLAGSAWGIQSNVKEIK